MVCWDAQKGHCPRVAKFGNCKYCSGKGDGKGWSSGKGGQSWSNGKGGQGWSSKGARMPVQTVPHSKGWTSPPVYNQTLKWNQEPAWGKGKGKGKGKKKPLDPSRTVWVGGVPAGSTYQELKAHVQACGLAPLWAEAYQGRGAGTAAVGFKTAPEAEE
eukprot:CAMPEP_0181482482 /NCGR_PEP_ID=MMETSP1110-20121109/44881_1 /TAXON_ID=174948 /ORGANISM="Symbiodinium sp., Strain CCMP421" /LENGTH=157 /DNA_ID=CAMNT_0023608069 /DNA_START=63 /DNA_END=533 /DNA_ORIENTATION=+